MSTLTTWAARTAGRWAYWLLLLPGGCALVGLALLGPVAVQRLAVERQCLAMQAEVDTLQETADRLAAAEYALENDPAYIERVVRHELGVTRPGEVHLARPVPLGIGLTETPVPPEPVLPPMARPLVALAHHMSDPTTRCATLMAGVFLLAVGVVFSLPSRPPRGRRTATARA